MGKWTSGYLTQNFEIRLDVDKLREFLTDKVLEAIEDEKTNGKQTFTDVELDESFFEDGELVITGSYDTAFKHWHCRATLESPEEDETEYEGIDGLGDGTFLYALPDALKGLVTVNASIANEDMVEFHGYDPDDYYED